MMGGYFCKSSSSLSKHVARTLAQPCSETMEWAKEKSPVEHNVSITGTTESNYAGSTFANEENMVIGFEGNSWTCWLWLLVLFGCVISTFNLLSIYFAAVGLVL